MSFVGVLKGWGRGDGSRMVTAQDGGSQTAAKRCIAFITRHGQSMKGEVLHRQQNGRVTCDFHGEYLIRDVGSGCGIA